MPRSSHLLQSIRSRSLFWRAVFQLQLLPRGTDLATVERRADLLTVARLRLALAHRHEAALYPASRLP